MHMSQYQCMTLSSHLLFILVVTTSLIPILACFKSVQLEEHHPYWEGRCTLWVCGYQLKIVSTYKSLLSNHCLIGADNLTDSKVHHEISFGKTVLNRTCLEWELSVPSVNIFLKEKTLSLFLLGSFFLLPSGNKTCKTMGNKVHLGVVLADLNSKGVLFLPFFWECCQKTVEKLYFDWSKSNTQFYWATCITSTTQQMPLFCSAHAYSTSCTYKILW